MFKFFRNNPNGCLENKDLNEKFVDDDPMIPHMCVITNLSSGVYTVKHSWGQQFIVSDTFKMKQQGFGDKLQF